MTTDGEMVKRCLKPEVVKKVNKGVNKEQNLEETLGNSSAYPKIKE